MRLLETHGCQGGAHAGYVRAGWDVTGVDIDQRHARYYPGELIIALAMHPCGHWPSIAGCGGCDPSAIDYEFGGAA